MSRHRKPTRLEKSGRLVRLAAKILRDRKWTKGTVGNPVNGMCAVGAIGFAATGQALMFHPILGDENCTNQQIKLATTATHDFGTWLHDNDYSSNHSVPSWNDNKNRTAEEVITYMEKFADETDPRIL